MIRTINQLIEAIEVAVPDLVDGGYGYGALMDHVQVKGGAYIYDVASWRGNYSEFTVCPIPEDDVWTSGYNPLNVMGLYNLLLGARAGAIYEGYSGGLYKMDGDRQVYLDDNNRAAHKRILRVEHDKVEEILYLVQA